jgi:hypothetical protein
MRGPWQHQYLVGRTISPCSDFLRNQRLTSASSTRDDGNTWVHFEASVCELHAINAARDWMFFNSRIPGMCVSLYGDSLNNLGQQTRQDGPGVDGALNRSTEIRCLGSHVGAISFRVCDEKSGIVRIGDICKQLDKSGGTRLVAAVECSRFGTVWICAEKDEDSSTCAQFFLRMGCHYLVIFQCVYTVV